MKIISKFHDYYDPIAKTKGVDTLIQYRRETDTYQDHETQKFVESLDLPSVMGQGHNPYDISMTIIGFCGKIYPCMKYEEYTKTAYSSPMISKTQYYYDIPTIDALIKGRKTHSRWSWMSRYRNKDYKETLKSQALYDRFMSYRAPVVRFGITPGQPWVVVNPQLKEINFARCVDPFTAFQEIEMYISGVLGAPTKPMVQISDKHRLLAHGFDAKTSFRKAKSK